MYLLPKVGQRIRLDYMAADPCPIEPGEMGTVRYITEPWPGTMARYIGVKWDNGRTLDLIYNLDLYSII